MPEQVAEAQPCPTLPADSLEPSRKRARTRPEGSSSAAGLQSPQSSGVRAASPGQPQARSPLRPAAQSPETSGAGAGTSAQGSLSSGAKIRHELQALPPAARLEQHDHANGVLPAQDFLRCLFDLHSTAPATSNNQPTVARVFAALGKGLTKNFATKLRGIVPQEPINAIDIDSFWPHADRMQGLNDELAAIPAKDESRHQAQLADLRARLSVLQKMVAIEQGPPDAQAFKMAWILRSLAAHPLADGDMPAIDFDWCYDARKILWAEVDTNKPNENVDKHLIKSIGDISTIPTKIEKGTPLFIQNFETLITPDTFRIIKDAIVDMRRECSIWLDVASDSNHHLLASSDAEKKTKTRSLLAALKDLEKSSDLLQLKYRPNARRLLFFDAMFAHLTSPENAIRSVQLQGRIPANTAPAWAVQHLAETHGIEVSWLSTIPHENLADPFEPDAVIKATHNHIKKCWQAEGGVPFAGIDVAGPEHTQFHPEAIDTVLKAAVQAIEERRAQLEATPEDWKAMPRVVVRVHAGETHGVVSAMDSERQQMGRENCALVVAAVKTNAEAQALIRAGSLEVRIGHAIFFDTRDLRPVAELGIGLEFNPESNQATHTDPNKDMTTFQRTVLWNAMEEVASRKNPTSTPTLQVLYSLNTDGPGVMRTSFSANLLAGQRAIKQRLIKKIEQKTYQMSADAFSNQHAAAGRALGLAPAASSGSVGPASDVPRDTAARAGLIASLRRRATTSGLLAASRQEPASGADEASSLAPDADSLPRSVT